MKQKRVNPLTTLKIPFVQNKKIIFIIPAVLVVVGLLSMFIRGFAWGTDFIGGTSMQIHIGSQLNTEALAEITSITEGVINKKVSAVQRTGEGNEDVLIKCTEIDTELRDEVFHALKDRYNLTDADRLNVTSIGASVSADFRRAGLISVSLAVVLMLCYITFRFSFKSGIAAILCLTHDLFMMLTAYSLLQLPMNSNVIAALLTILGYSINATIIVFDRVRENLKLNQKASFEYNVNLSINQTLMRSINTTITTLLTIVMIYILGVTSIKEFILPLIVGILAGLYSSICLAGNFWCILQNGVKKKETPAAAAAETSAPAQEKPRELTEEEINAQTKDTSIMSDEMK
ncbi:MAG: protein translocase subunit SecF [Clostridia bacterium]|nr:protein translocase subunit SecF [Clostridia bacterium]